MHSQLGKAISALVHRLTSWIVRLDLDFDVLGFVFSGFGF
jgi:hypothetical protein